VPIASPETAQRTARTIGSEVPPGEFHFRVHSVFESALNLQVAGRRFLVTLLSARAGEYPHGIRLDSVERFVWSFPEIEVVDVGRDWLEVDAW